MERRRLAGFGIVLGLAALSGCAAPAPGVVAVADLPPPTVAVVPVAVVMPPPQAVWVPPPRRHVAAVHHVAVVHRVATRHWVRRYHHAQAYYVPWTPQCGSDVRPCNPEHVETPFP